MTGEADGWLAIGESAKRVSKPGACFGCWPAPCLAPELGALSRSVSAPVHDLVRVLVQVPARAHVPGSRRRRARWRQRRRRRQQQRQRARRVCRDRGTGGALQFCTLAGAAAGCAVLATARGERARNWPSRARRTGC
jgi:hypothetical protein